MKKKFKDIYELKDILYKKFDYWDVEDIAGSVRIIIDEQIENAVASQYNETIYWRNLVNDLESERNKLQRKVNWLKKKLKEYEQDDEETIPF